MGTALALGYHHSEHLHSIAAVDIVAPTGSYDHNRLANPGRNYWSIAPVYTTSYVNPAGWNLGVKLMYDCNFRNRDTDYRSCQEAHKYHAAGYGVAPNWGRRTAWCGRWQQGARICDQVGLDGSRAALSIDTGSSAADGHTTITLQEGTIR
jgi:hypothetical protein